MFHLVKKFFQTAVPGIVRPLHALWTEVIGFLFLAFGILLARPVWKLYRELDDDPANLIRLFLTAFFMFVLLGFGVQSFLKARKISKS